MRPVLLAWQKEFRAQHPDVRFENRLLGSGSGMAGIITGVSDFAVMGRPATANEIMGFEWVHRYKPRGIEVLTGSVDTPGDSPALVAFVHRTNPIHQVTLDQLRRILGCCEVGAKIGTWEQLGAEGSWRGQRIHVYVCNSETGAGGFLQKSILGTGDKWDWSMVTEFGDFRRPNSIAGMDAQIMSAFARDPYGLAISTLPFAAPDARPLALAADSNGPFVVPNKSSIASRQYPLIRSIYIYVDSAPGKPLNPLVKAFLLFVLSPKSQQQAAVSGRFLPLPAPVASEQAREVSQ